MIDSLAYLVQTPKSSTTMADYRHVFRVLLVSTVLLLLCIVYINFPMQLTEDSIYQAASTAEQHLYPPVKHRVHIIKLTTVNNRSYNKTLKVSSSADQQSNASVVHLDAINSPYVNPRFHMDISEHKMNISAGKDKGAYTILWWNSPDWLTTLSQSVVQNQDLKHCEYTNCKLSLDKEHFNQSHAVAFDLAHTEMGYQPPVAPNARNPDQAWMFFTLESPLHIRSTYKSPQWSNVFNWSWTYHPGADIFHPYGTLVPKLEIPNRNYSNIFKKKTKVAAWLVSNCHSQSLRNAYVDILKRYITVDIFGRCGNRPFDGLLQMVSEKYKFYLGFENSFCEDYFTEKFFHYYPLDVITILRGSNNYQAYLPSGSYIDTANYSTIAELGKFLQELGTNEEEYVNYLRVKDRYKVYDTSFMYKDALCNVCGKLNNLNSNRRTYSDVEKWLGKCKKPIDLIEN